MQGKAPSAIKTPNLPGPALRNPNKWGMKKKREKGLDLFFVVQDIKK